MQRALHNRLFSWRTGYRLGLRIAACLALVLALCSTAYGQDITVTGTVTDSLSGEPLPGVNIQVEGTTVGTATNARGQYELEAPEDGSLLFSFVGYESRTVPVDGRSVIDVQLVSETLTGGEVVVVGYSTQRRADLTGAVDVANVANMQKLSSEQVAEQMQGQVSGVTINTSGQPGEQPQINIRGLNTFGNNQPLFVVDGVSTQDISHLNPRDIESLQVLKDAGSAAQYGARAANGVVVITTNRGGGDQIRVNYNASVGYQVPKSGNVWNALSPQEFGELEWMARQNSGETPEEISHPIWGDGTEPQVPTYLTDDGGASDVNPDNYFVIPEYTESGMEGDFYQIAEVNQAGTNWYEEIFSPALQTNHNLSVGGGGDLGNYYASLSYTNQEGTLMNTHLQRYTTRVNTEFNVSDNFRIGENLTFALIDNPQATTLSEGSAIGMSYRQNTIIPVYDIQGNFAGTRAEGLGNAKNPVAFRDRASTDDGENRRLFGNVFVELDFLQDFRLRTSFGADISSGYNKWFSYPEYENAENLTTNGYNEQVWNNREWTWTSTLNFQRSFGEHNVEILAATEAIHNTTRFDQVSRQSYFSFNPDYTNLGTGAGAPTINTASRGVNTLLSLIGDVGYDYDNTYLLNLTVRRDGSSKFLNNQWGTFPSVTAGWRASELAALQDIGWLTDLKIRGGYGTMGNQLNVDINNAYTLFGGTEQNAYYPIGGEHTSTQQGFRQVRIGNADAQWERITDVNIGFDLAVLNGQIEVTADYYRKEVEDLLYDPAFPATAGAADVPFRNVASMRNQGVDLSLRGGTNLSEDLELNTQFTFTTYNNEITEVSEGADYFSADARRFGLEIVRNEIGHPISSYYGYDVAGLWTADEIAEVGTDYQDDMAPGRFRYRDVNGDGQITDADRTHLGNPHPDFTYGLNMDLTYRNWDFTLFLYGEQGKELWNQVKWWTDFYGSFNGAKGETALHDSWRPQDRNLPRMEWEAENPNAEAPIQEADQYFSTSAVPNSYFVEDGSYLRLRNVQVGYTLAPQFIQQAGLQNLRIYLQAENVFTITGYSGLDPEIGATSNSTGGTPNFGIDEGSYSTPRTFTMGVNLSF